VNNINALAEKIQEVTEKALMENPTNVFGLFLTLAAFIAADSCRSDQEAINAEEAAARLFKQAIEFRRSNNQKEILH
jgi:hypothetical protein